MADLTFKTLHWVNSWRNRKLYPYAQEWTTSDWAMALAGEVGELCNKLKKRRAGMPVTQDSIEEEIADTVLYLDLLCSHLGIDMEKAVIQKFNATSHRKGSDIRL